MARKHHSAEEIVNKLRRPDVGFAKGTNIAAVCKLIEVTEQAYYRRRCEFGGMKVDQAKQLKDLENVNIRLKRLFADAELDKAMLKELACGETSEPAAETRNGSLVARTL